MDLSLPFERWGRRGEVPVLALHGFTGNRTSWRHLEPWLGHRLELIAVDLPGHGAAPLPSERGPAGFEQALEALERVIDALGVPQVDVLGYSQGARLGLALAIRAPSRVRRLVLESVNPGLRRAKERAARCADDEALAASIEQQGLEAFLARWEALPLFRGISRLADSTRAALRERRRAATVDGLAGALRSLGLGVQPDLWPRLPLLRPPTLLLTGAEDAKFTAIAKAMVRELPQGWARSFPGVTHTPHLEVPEAYCQEVCSFLGVPAHAPHLPARDEAEDRLRPAVARLPVAESRS